MKILIAEDDLASRKILLKFLSQYGQCDITVDGLEAMEAFIMAEEDGEAYDLICLDIMMPKMDGIKVLKAIRTLEKDKDIHEKHRSKIIMMTALNDIENVNECFEYDCDAYAAKPLNLEKIEEVIKKIGIIS